MKETQNYPIPFLGVGFSATGQMTLEIIFHLDKKITAKT
jgi:hypothetical protein